MSRNTPNFAAENDRKVEIIVDKPQKEKQYEDASYLPRDTGPQPAGYVAEFSDIRADDRHDRMVQPDDGGANHSAADAAPRPRPAGLCRPGALRRCIAGYMSAAFRMVRPERAAVLA